MTYTVLGKGLLKCAYIHSLVFADVRFMSVF